VAHGVALKPGKPICLAATAKRPFVVLPGFPTSAIFTFHEFVAPVVTAMAGRVSEARAVVQATLAVRVNSEIGRTEYLLVGLVDAGSANVARTLSGPRGEPDKPRPTGLMAYPMGQGSGSVTTFSRADGFTTIGRHEEIVPAGTTVEVHLLGRELQLADLVVMGSHCIGLDLLLGELQQHGIRSKFVAVGSLAGLEAAKRGECDVAGIHLLDPHSGQYNRPFMTRSLDLIPGYGRMQGIVFRKGDERFEERPAGDAVAMALRDPACVMVNRNQGSGTRALIDRLLAGAKPPGYAVQPRNHNAVAAAVRQGRADWGVTLDTIARNTGLGFIPLQLEEFDFVAPKARADRPAVKALRALLSNATTRQALIRLGMKP
jgi:putative molybdopterin biosynthesis protein